MALSKFDLAIVVFVAAGMLWIEHGHRTSIATPTAAEIPAASACPGQRQRSIQYRLHRVHRWWRCSRRSHANERRSKRTHRIARRTLPAE
jgi:hypothetical protein